MTNSLLDHIPHLAVDKSEVGAA